MKEKRYIPSGALVNLNHWLDQALPDENY